MATEIVIPSAGRADAVLTKIDGAILYVPESQADAYHAANQGARIETHADNAHRGLAGKRQDIYRRWGDVFMADDDIAYVSRIYMPGNKKNHLTPTEVHELIQMTAHNARSAGVYLYGFAHSANPRHYHAQKPINLTGYINGCAMGLLPSEKLYFTDRTTAAESHWINLLNAVMHRKCWVDLRFCFAQSKGSTFFRTGGQTEKRTLETERMDTIFLRRMFGQAVQVKQHRNATPKLHQYQRTIRNPL